MRSTRIVTSFIIDREKLLILKRSGKVKSMRGLWSGVSGIIEGDEGPLARAKIEILEEVGITEDMITLVRSSKEMRISSPQYRDHEWEVFPFLFEARDPPVRLNWENSEFRWIGVEGLKDYDTVPSLQKVLSSLL